VEGKVPEGTGHKEGEEIMKGGGNKLGFSSLWGGKRKVTTITHTPGRKRDILY